MDTPTWPGPAALMEHFADEFNKQLGSGQDVRSAPRAMAKLRKQVRWPQPAGLPLFAGACHRSCLCQRSALAALHFLASSPAPHPQ